ncbi:MAG: [amino group carrier protein]-lysine/ornithine hydrolase [Thermoproteota archaeon]|nr:[amino group carrier protein]-lysine/ornithine hydrolase [Thermoproteota archaeon]
MQNYAVNLLTKLLEIYSPFGGEKEISNFLLEEMRSLGFHSWTDEVGNVFGEIGTGKPSVLLCGHMDTIQGYLPVKHTDGKIYGRGAVDAKAPLAAMILATSLLQKEGFLGKVIVAGLVDEEGAGRGVRHLLSKNVQADYAIFGEPSGVENITIAYKGSLHLKIIFETKTGHSSAPWLFDNSVEKAFEFWNMIKGIHFLLEKPESRFYSLTSCITGIKGGDASSTVPSKCEFHIDLRFPPPLTPQEVFAAVKESAQKYKATNPGTSVSFTLEDSNPAFEANKSSPLIRAMSIAIKKISGKPASLLRKTGTGDMNLFGIKTKIPVITYGPGSSHLDHTSDENIEVKEYLDGVAVLYEGLKRLYDLEKSTETHKDPN